MTLYQQRPCGVSGSRVHRRQAGRGRDETHAGAHPGKARCSGHCPRRGGEYRLRGHLRRLAAIGRMPMPCDQAFETLPRPKAARDVKDKSPPLWRAQSGSIEPGSGKSSPERVAVRAAQPVRAQGLFQLRKLVFGPEGQGGGQKHRSVNQAG